MSEWVEQWICIKFCVKFEHSSVEAIQMIQKPVAMGNWWLAAPSRQTLAHVSRAVQNFLVKHQITQVTQPSCCPDLAPCDFWLFPKLKSPLKGGKLQTINEIQENTRGQLWQLGELCEVPRCLLWRGLRHHCPMYCFLYLVSSSTNVSTFHITWLDTF